MAIQTRLIADLRAVACSGTLALVAAVDCRSVGPVRVYVKNVGASNALTAAVVKIGPDATHLATLDSTTFAALAANGGIAQLLVASPADYMEITATCASGTTLDIQVSSAVSPVA